jgi:uncharacterized protein (DUF1697 family)
VPTYVSLLRGVNVGGRNKVAMSALREVFDSIGHRDVATYVQSGNVVSTTGTRRPADVARAVERAITDRFGIEVVVLVRTPAELAETVAANPYAGHHADPTKLHVTFLRELPAHAAVEELDPDRFAPDVFTISGHEIYLHCPHGYGSTKINNGYFERQLGVAATTRNWKTVRHLAELAGS